MAIVVVQLVLFPAPAGIVLLGLILGALNALVALGMALIYRANRILNFAQGDLGSAPTVLAVGLISFSGLNYFLSFAIGLVGALVLGTAVEFLIIRRFLRAPRLILTVATLGLSQLLTVIGLLLPRLWHQNLFSEKIDAPISWSFTLGARKFAADDLIALVVATTLLVALGLFLSRTDTGVAIRASAERDARAASLGIPVRRLQTVVWAIATVLSYVAVFLRASVLSLPAVSTLSLLALSAALTALMVGKLTDLPAIATAAVALGVLEQGVIWNNSDSPSIVYPVFGIVLLVALLTRRMGRSRAEQDDTATWQASDEIRPVPAELRRLPEVLSFRALLGVGVVAFALTLPLWTGDATLQRAGTVLVYALVAVSIVVLTGWAGQVSLGQMSFAAVGGVLTTVAVVDWHADLFTALVLAGLAGAATAVVVGLPALRLRGLFLAATTLAFALATSSFLLNRQQFSWIPRDQFERPRLFNYFDLSSQRAIYYVCLGTLALGMLAVHGIRRSRAGRVLVALRDNERGVQAYGVSVVRAKLTAFALSGFLAAVAGGLSVQLLQRYAESLFTPAASLNVFTGAVIGGLGSLAGAFIGALYLQGGSWLLPVEWQLLPTALGVLVVLWVLPGGASGGLYRLRDLALRRIAERRGLVVPSLVADVRVEEADDLALSVDPLAGTEEPPPHEPPTHHAPADPEPALEGAAADSGEGDR